MPGRGIPNELCQQTNAAPVTEDAFPTAQVASAAYTEDLGSTLTSVSEFAPSPFHTDDAHQRCEAEFSQSFPDLLYLFKRAVNGDYIPLQHAIRRLVELTRLHST